MLKKEMLQLIVGETHTINITHPTSPCETPGHTDVKLDCSCGFTRTIPHGYRKDIEPHILYHRLETIERILGIEISVTWVAP